MKRKTLSEWLKEPDILSHDEVAAQLEALVRAELADQDLAPFQDVLDSLGAYPDLYERYEHLLDTLLIEELDAAPVGQPQKLPQFFPQPKKQGMLELFGPAWSWVKLPIKLQPLRGATFSDSILFDDIIDEPEVGHVRIDQQTLSNGVFIHISINALTEYMPSVVVAEKTIPFTHPSDNTWSFGPLPAGAVQNIDELTILFHPVNH